MTTERISTRHGQNGGHVVARFELTETLQPNYEAVAKFVFWSGMAAGFYAADGANLEITVHSTFFRSFGLKGERGWAMYFPDTDRWEVISMGGSLMRPATAGAVIASGGTGNVTISDGTNTVVVTAKNWGQISTAISDRVTVFYDPSQEEWLIISGGTGGDETKIVKVYSGTANANCMWPGKITAPVGDASSHCTDQFPNDVDCFLVVLNSETGSTGSKDGLTVGEAYIGQKVGDYDNGDTTFTPVYAIRTGEGEPKPVTPFELYSELVWGVDTMVDNAYNSNPPGTVLIKVFDKTGRTWEGKAGAKGWAQQRTGIGDEGKFDIIWMENTARGIYFVLRPNLSSVTVEGNFQGRQSIVTNPALFDEAGLFPRKQNGSNGIAFYDPENERYVPLNMETQAGWVFGALEAKMDLKASYVDASLYLHGGTQQDVQAPPDNEQAQQIISVYQLLYAHALSGADFIGIFDAALAKYAPLVVDQKALLIECRAYNDFKYDDVVVEVYEPRRLTPFPFSGEDPTTTTVNNPFGLWGKSGDLLLCCYDEFAERYEVILANPPAEIGRCTVDDDTLGWGWGATAVVGLGYGILSPPLLVTNAGGAILEKGNTPIVVESIYDGQYYAIKTEPDLLIRSPFEQNLLQFGAYPIMGSENQVVKGMPVLKVRAKNTGSNDFNNGLQTVCGPRASLSFGATVGQPGPFVLGYTGSAGGSPNATINGGEMWGVNPSSSGYMTQGYPGFSYIGVTDATYAEDAPFHPHMFKQETISVLKVQLNSLVENNQQTDDYDILVGKPLGTEHAGSWENRPFAYNQTGARIDADAICFLLRCPSGWHFLPLETPDNRIPFINNSGQTIPAWSFAPVVGTVDVTTLLPGVADGVTFLGGTRIPRIVKPQATFYWPFLINGADAVIDGALGYAQAGPIYRVQAGTGVPVAGEGWGMKVGEWGAYKGHPGLVVIGGPDADNTFLAEKPALIRLLGKMTAAVAPGTSTTNWRIWCGGGQGTEVDGGWTTLPQAWNRTDVTIAGGTFVYVTLVNGRWELELPFYRLHELVKTTTTHGAGGTAIVNVWVGAPGAETQSVPLQTLNATNRTSQAILSNKFCLATQIRGNWYIEPWQC